MEQVEVGVMLTSAQLFNDLNVKPCPFLTSSRTCAIYNVRPHKCRACLSKVLPSASVNQEGMQNKTSNFLQQYHN
jgi:Fe-S-cluster containining protein